MSRCQTSRHYVQTSCPGRERKAHGKTYRISVFSSFQSNVNVRTLIPRVSCMNSSMHCMPCFMQCPSMEGGRFQRRWRDGADIVASRFLVQAGRQPGRMRGPLRLVLLHPGKLLQPPHQAPVPGTLASACIARRRLVMCTMGSEVSGRMPLLNRVDSL